MDSVLNLSFDPSGGMYSGRKSKKAAGSGGAMNRTWE